MNDHVLDLLDEWVDGELPANAAVQVESHLAGCAQCRAAERELRALLASAQSLPASIDPPAEVWAAVRAITVDQRRHQRSAIWSLRYPLAAAALGLMLISSGLTVWLLRPEAPAATAMAESPHVVLTAAHQEYERISRELESALAQREPALDTATTRIVRENLNIIDNAIAEARAALAKNPENPNLSRLISTSYQRKIQVLERTLRLSASS